MDELAKYMKGLMALQLRAMAPEEQREQKLEVLLRQIGFSIAEIATLMGKSEAAVAKTLSRAKPSKR